MDNHELLAGYKESLKVAWGYNDYEDWPLRISSIMHLFTDTFAQEFLEDVEALWTDELGPELMSQIFVYPGRLFRLIDVVIFGLRRIRTPSISEEIYHPDASFCRDLEIGRSF